MMQRFIHTFSGALILLLAGCGFSSQVKFSLLKTKPYTETAIWSNVDYYKPVHKVQVQYFFDNKPYTGSVIDYYPGLDVVRFKGEMENGLPAGQWTYFFSSGKIQMQGSYVAGSADSIWHKYYPDTRPMVIEQYKQFVDTLYCDTLGAWYKGGMPSKTVSGDTFITFYPNGKWAVYTVGKPALSEWRYTDYGMLTSAYFNFRREEYGPGKKLLRKIYFTNTEDGRNALFADQDNWSAQQRKDIAKADSVEFVYDIPTNPLVKIYWGH